MTLIATEHFSPPNFKEFIFVLIISFIVIISWHLINLLNLSSVNNSIASLFILIFLSNLTVLIVKKVGPVFTIFLLTSLFTWNLNFMLVSGLEKFILLIASSLFFDAVYLILKLKVKNLSLDLLFASILASLILPIVSIAIQDYNLLLKYPSSIFLSTVIFGLFGLLSSLLAGLIWFKIQYKQPILKLESYLKSLIY